MKEGYSLITANAKAKVITAMLLFGSMGLLVKHIPLPASTLALGRGLLGALFLLCLSLALKQPLNRAALRRNAKLLLLSGLVLSANWIFLFEAFKHTKIATATLTYYLAPVFVVLSSPWLLHEKLTRTKISCVAAALGGMLLVSASSLQGLGSGNDAIGIACGIAAALFYASMMLLNKFIQGLSGSETTAAQLGIAALVLAPYVWLTEGVPAALSWDNALLLLILGIVHTGIAFWLYFSSLQQLNAQTAAVLSYLDPLTAIFLSATLLQESLTPPELVGALLILGATTLGEYLDRRQTAILPPPAAIGKRLTS